MENNILEYNGIQWELKTQFKTRKFDASKSKVQDMFVDSSVGELVVIDYTYIKEIDDRYGLTNEYNCDVKRYIESEEDGDNGTVECGKCLKKLKRSKAFLSDKFVYICENCEDDK